MGRNVDNIGGVAQAAANAGSPLNRRNIRFVDGGGVSWTIVDDPLNDEVEVSASAASGGVPAGAIMAYGGTVAPAGWVECDGTTYGRTGGDPSPQPNLFAAIGTTWGVGDGSTSFNVPNLARRTLVGSGGSGTGTLGNFVGAVGGDETHTLTLTETPVHAHNYNNLTNVQVDAGSLPSVPHNTFGPFIVTSGSNIGSTIVPSMAPSSGGTANSGGGAAHNNVQPSAVVMYIIKT